MLHLKLTTGADIFINALAVRYVLGNGSEDQCDVHFGAGGHVTVANDAKHVADTIHRALRIIHEQG